MNRWHRLGLALALTIASCGDGSSRSHYEAKLQETQAPVGGLLNEPVSFAGTVNLKGTPPVPDELSTATVPPNVIKALGNPAKILWKHIETDGENRIKGALIYVKKGLEGRKYDPPEAHKTLVVENMYFKPRVMGIMVGQELHLGICCESPCASFHTLPFNNRESNDFLREKKKTIVRTFSTPELAIRVRSECTSVLDEAQNAWINVFSHPYYAVTGEGGRYELRGIPPGKYTLEAWQENCVPQTKEIEVKERERQDLDFELKEKPKEK